VRSEETVLLNQWNRLTLYRHRWDAWIQLNNGKHVEGRSKVSSLISIPAYSLEPQSALTEGFRNFPQFLQAYAATAGVHLDEREKNMDSFHRDVRATSVTIIQTVWVNGGSRFPSYFNRLRTVRCHSYGGEYEDGCLSVVVSCSLVQVHRRFMGILAASIIITLKRLQTSNRPDCATTEKRAAIFNPRPA
jgi:hypothetical protein